MNAAGVDVSKGKSMVSVLRPPGQVVAKPFEVWHTGSKLRELAKYLKSLEGETGVVMAYGPLLRADSTVSTVFVRGRDICQCGEPEAHQRLQE